MKKSSLLATVALPILLLHFSPAYALPMANPPSLHQSKLPIVKVAMSVAEAQVRLEAALAALEDAKANGGDVEAAQAAVNAAQAELDAASVAPAAEPAPEPAPAAEPAPEPAPAVEPVPAPEPIAEPAPAAEPSPAVVEEAPKPKHKEKQAAEPSADQAPAADVPAADVAPVEPAPEATPAEPTPEAAPAAEEAPVVKDKPKHKKKQAAEPAPDQPPAADVPATDQPAETVAPATDAAPKATEPAPADVPKPKDKKKPAAEPAPAEPTPAPDAAPAADAPAPATNDATPSTDPAKPAAEAAPATDAAPAEAAEAAKVDPTAPAEVKPAADAQATADPVKIEENKKIAADPAKTTETIVLPVANGAAVLDSDKEADTQGSGSSRKERQKQRAEEKAQPAPTSDAQAQTAPAGGGAAPAKAQPVDAVAGQKIDKAPVYIEQNNVTIQTVIDNRTIINVDNRVVVKSDDTPRLSRNAERSFYEQLPQGRVRETIVKADESRIVTIRNRYGDIIQRSIISPDGEEFVLFYSPELDRGRPQQAFIDPGDELPPMRLVVPVPDYIIDTSSQPDRDFGAFLRKPPVERVERVYSLDEVKYSARIRDKVRRIDLDTITFATGSADISLNQANSLKSVAKAIRSILKKDPGETFLIEGHTDAVGSYQSNLVLSDQRAESVANVLTDVFDIPAENLATQGYGERFLKVVTDGPEEQNRRVTIRRVTALVRPVAAK